MTNLTTKERAHEYANQSTLKLTAFLGDGTNGTVWKSHNNTAIKAFAYEKKYRMELAVPRPEASDAAAAADLAGGVKAVGGANTRSALPSRTRLARRG